MIADLEWLKITNEEMIVAVDFDGTLCEEEVFPNIGKAKLELIETLKQIGQVNKKVKLILYTCREGNDLQAAVNFCKEYGLIFDAHNDNLESVKAQHGRNPRKIVANLYIDDRAINPTMW